MKNLNPLYLIAVVGMTFFASCSTIDQELITVAERVNERIDMAIEGDEHELVYLSSDEDDNNANLIDFNYYGSTSTHFDIKVNIDENRTIVFRLTSNSTMNLWEKEGSYNMYTTQDLQDKDKYVTVELIDNNPEATTYHSNAGNDFPRQTYLNVFSRPSKTQLVI